MTFVEKHRLGGGHGEHAWLKMSWEGEIFGVGMFEAMAEIQPEHADEATACATMEWFNIHRLEDFGHAAGVIVSLEQAEKLGCEGEKLVRTHSFEEVAKLTIEETPAADKMYEHLGKDASTPELKAFADDLVAHENALRDWIKSELEGKSDGAEKVFAYLERNGITREDAVIPRKDREESGGEKQQLVLAFFDTEDAADQAAKALKDWEKATEYMKVDGIGVLVKTTTARSRSTSSASAPASEGWASASPSGWSRRSPPAASPWSEGFSEAPAEALPSASSSTRA